MNISKAFLDWSHIEGVLVFNEEEAYQMFSSNTLDATRKVLGVLRVQSVAHVQAIVRVANDCKVPLYPISGGHNWGYGSALPATDNCVILDLSSMNRIVEFNNTLGYVVLEPGVNQGQLYDYIVENDFSYMVPTTGAGPQGSIIGNALEKGYGITPEQDHFGAVLTLKAVLPNGEIYESALSKFGGYRSDALFKWKVGPYLEGLFVQGNMGIVVQATIALSLKPPSVTQFLVFLDDKNFEDAVNSVAKIKQQFGHLLGGVNMMNKRRLLSMVATQEEWQSTEVLSEMYIRGLVKKRNLSDWVVMGGVYCPVELNKGVMQCISKEFGKTAKHIVFLNQKKVTLLRYLLQFLPFQKLSNTVKSVDRALHILQGVPDTVALALAYLKNTRIPSDKEKLSPDKDNCGLIWFSPLLPIEASFVRDYVQEITRVCLSKGVEPLITLTAISERCFDSTVPIVFNKDDREEMKRAKECYKLLLELSKEMGVFPYRLGIETMREEYDTVEGSCFTMLEQIKKAVDPNNIISPGRYSKKHSSELR